MKFKSTQFKKGSLILLLLTMATYSGKLMAQLTGTKNIPGDYATLALAITDLNTVGVGPGGVTLNLVAGNPETAPLGGYSITATGVSANQIALVGNGNTITAAPTQSAGAINDAVFKIIGGDYITLSGFTIQENAANTTTATATNNMTEFGIGVFYASVTNGANNVTIQNNTISLNRTYPNTFGIYSNSTHDALSVTTASTATGANGGNHNLKIYGNTISNVNMAVIVVGPTAAADHNQGLDIGGTSSAQGNMISNFGTSNAISSYSNVSGTVNGILVKNTGNYNISYNSIVSSNGGTTVGTLRGIYVPSFNNIPTAALVQTINSNTVSLQSAVASGAINSINVEATTSSALSTLSINNNNITTTGHTVAGTGAITFILNAVPVATTSINGNMFSNLSVNTTGSVTFINNSVTRPANALCNVNNNMVVGTFAKTGAGGTILFYTSNGATPITGTENNTGNNFSNMTFTGGTTISGWASTDGSTTAPYGPSKNVSNNIFSNITGGSNAITLINIAYSNANATTNAVSNNTITSVTGSAAITGIASAQGAQNMINNTINSFTTTGGSAVVGLAVSGGTIQNVAKNKIYNLVGTNASSTVNGILVSGGVTNNIYNNLVGDLRTPAASATNPLIGISLTGGTTDNVYYNTVYLSGSSSGTNFGSSALSSNGTPTTINLRNNIFINNVTPAGTGIATAYRRSAAALTNYGTASNNNIFYAGTPSATTPIFYDGTTVQQTLANFKTFVGATREAASFTENVVFASTTGSAATFLHITNGSTSLAESGGTNISTYTDDFDGDIRQGNAGYAGTGTSPDIGADEFAGISITPAVNSATTSPVGNQCVAVGRTVTANITPGAAPLTSVVLSYSFNGIAQPTVAMTGGNVSATSNWTGAIPVASPVNANVTWNVSATDGTYTKVFNGTSYKDAPLTGITATAVTSSSVVCAGSSATLSVRTPAQAQIGVGALTTSGSGGSGGNNVSPFSHYFGGNRFQYMVRASELTAMGLGAGSITSLAFDVTSIGTTYNGFEINVTQTATTDLSGGFITAGLTPVYSGNVTPSVGINTYTFSTPYNWDGVSNMIFQICWSNNNTGGTASEVKYDNTSFVSDYYNRRDNYTPAAACADNTNAGSTSARPKMIIDIIRSTGYSYSWSDGVTTIGTTTANIVVTPTNNTTYTAILTDPVSTCTISSSPVSLTVTPLPAAPTVTNSTQCGNGIPTAMVSGGTAYNWYASPTATTVLQSGASQTYTNSISVTTTFYVTSAVGLCESPRTAVMASVTQPDAVNAVASSTTICPAGSVTLTAVQTGTTNPYTFSWAATPVAGSGLSSSVPGQSISVSPTAAGTYAYKVTATDGVCTTTAVVNVTLNNPPTITAAANPTVLCSGSTATLNATTPVIAAGTGTVGAGSGTSNSGGSPFYHGWGGAKVQYIYTAAELTAAGFSPGNITALGLNITAVGIPYEGFAINVGTTAQSAFASANTIGGLTQVFLGSGTNNSYLPTVGLNTFNFSTPIFWNGTDNIVVSICWSNATTGGASSTVKWDTYATNVGMYIYSDSQTISTVCGASTTIPASGGSSTTTGRPQTTFGGQVQAQGAGPLTWQWNPGAINTNTANVNPINTGTAAVTQVYTVTATNPITTCSSTATVGILVNPLPSTPLTTNSSQCGLGIPTASVSGGTSYNWYATPTSTTVLQSGASATYTSSINATTTWYVSSFNGTCLSARAAVTASVTIPDVVTAASTATAICPGGTFTLTATKTGTVNTYAYTWTASPAAGSGIPTSAPGATTAVTPTATGTYNYLVTAVDGVCTTTASINVSLNPLPNISNAMATPTAVCSAGSVTLSAISINALPGSATVGTNSSTDYTGGPYRQGAGTDNKAQWLFTAADLTAAGIAPGNITAIAFNVPTGSADVMNNFTVRMGATTTTAITTTYDAAPPVVFGPASVSAATGINTYTFATPFNWNGTSNVIIQVCHDVVTGGGGSTAVTRQATTNTTAYSNATGACTTTAGTAVAFRPVITFSAQVGTNVTSSTGFVWNPGAIPTNTAVVSPVNTGTNAVTQIYTVTATNPSTGCSNTATTSVVVNPVPVAPTAANSIQCGVGVPTASVSGGTGYKWYATPTSTTVLQSGATANYTTAISATTTWYVSSYNVNCESGRTAVTATVTAPDAVTAASTSTSVCPGQSFTLTATNTGTNNVYSYTWTATPAAGSGIATSVTGATTAVTPLTPGSRNYMVTAADAVCTTTAVVSVVASAPPAILASSTPSVLCSGSTATLNAVTPAIGSGSIAIGNGTGLTTTTEELTAFCNRRINYRQQTLYTAAELTAAGLYAGNITAISYSITTIGDAATNANFTVKCGTVAATAFTDYVVTTGFTTVLPSTTYTHASGLNTITFSTPYLWDGVSNLVVEVSHDGIDALYNAQTYYETLTVNRTVYGFNSATVGTLSTKRFNTILNGQAMTTSAGSVTWQWNPGAVNSNTMTVSPTTTGTSITPSYTVTAIDPATTCSNTAVVTITVNPIPTVTVAASTSSICSGTTASLTATGATTYTWMPAGGSSSVAVVSPAANTIYTVTGTSLGCSNSQTVSLNVTPTPTVVASASPSVICAGATVSLTASGATTYSWMPVNVGTASTTATPSVSTTYTVSGTTAGCTNTKTLTVTVNNVPTLTVTTNPATGILCTAGATATLTATGTSTAYVWSTGPNTASISVAPSSTTVYSVTGTNSCGVKTVTATITVATTPTIAAMSSATLTCANNPAVLTASATPGVTFSWNTGPSTMSISVSPSVTTTYTVTGTNACGTAVATVVQNVSPCVGIEEIAGAGEISIYPNPANDYVNISVPANLASAATSVEITDALGKIVMKESINTEVTTLRIAKLEEGVYFFRVITNSQTMKVGKVVKH